MLINIYIIIITHKKHQTAYILNQMQAHELRTRHAYIKEMTQFHAYVHIQTLNILPTHRITIHLRARARTSSKLWLKSWLLCLEIHMTRAI